MTKYTIEMTVPDDCDPSDLLERMQEVAAELYAAHEDDEQKLERGITAAQDAVSVTAVADRAQFTPSAYSDLF